MINTYWALIAIYSVLTLPFTTLVSDLYFRGLPDEVDEAARGKAPSSWRILKDITIPLALPSIIGAGLLRSCSPTASSSSPSHHHHP